MQDRVMMAMPITLASRRTRQGVLRRGREARQVCGVTRGEGSEDQAHWAKCWVMEDDEEDAIF